GHARLPKSKRNAADSPRLLDPVPLTLSIGAQALAPAKVAALTRNARPLHFASRGRVLAPSRSETVASQAWPALEGKRTSSEHSTRPLCRDSDVLAGRTLPGPDHPCRGAGRLDGIAVAGCALAESCRGRLRRPRPARSSRRVDPSKRTARHVRNRDTSDRLW